MDFQIRYPQGRREQLESIPTNGKLGRRVILVRRYRKIAKNLARSILKRWHAYLAEDEVESVADLSLCEAAMNYTPHSGVRFTSYLYYFVKGHLIRTLTQLKEEQQQRNPVDLDEHTSREQQPISPELVLHKKEMAFIVRTAWKKLRPLERQIIELYYYDEKSAAEIAKHLGRSRTTVLHSKQKALRKMKSAVLFHSFAPPSSQDRT